MCCVVHAWGVVVSGCLLLNIFLFFLYFWSVEAATSCIMAPRWIVGCVPKHFFETRFLASFFSHIFNNKRLRTSELCCNNGVILRRMLSQNIRNVSGSFCVWNVAFPNDFYINICATWQPSRLMVAMVL